MTCHIMLRLYLVSWFHIGTRIIMSYHIMWQKILYWFRMEYCCGLFPLRYRIVLQGILVFFVISYHIIQFYLVHGICLCHHVIWYDRRLYHAINIVLSYLLPKLLSHGHQKYSGLTISTTTTYLTVYVISYNYLCCSMILSCVIWYDVICVIWYDMIWIVQMSNNSSIDCSASNHS